MRKLERPGGGPLDASSPTSYPPIFASSSPSPTSSSQAELAASRSKREETALPPGSPSTPTMTTMLQQPLDPARLTRLSRKIGGQM